MRNSPANRMFSPFLTGSSSHQGDDCLSILKNFEIFTDLFNRAQKHLSHGRYNTAAVFAEIAAYSATWNHAGFFAHGQLENLLLEIGRRALGKTGTLSAEKPVAALPERILHVATWVAGLQGLNRLLTRWILNDSSRSHFLTVTGHGVDKIPECLMEAVLKSRGEIFELDKPKGNVIQHAARLRELASSFDLVVLHTQTEEVLPLIALHDRKCPVMFVNNADHNFWLGVGISDMVVNLRESGRRLSHDRRGIVAERNVLLPILLDRRERTRDRDEAKRQLGLGPGTVLILSIARAPKYRSVNGVSFAETHVPILMKYKNAVLWVIGPKEDDNWRRADEETGGRIKAFGGRNDTDVFYEAADLYVDSFPIVSITSLLEAGSYGVPLVSRFPYSEECGVLGADTPALEKCLIRAKTIGEYHSTLSGLIEDEGARERLGEQAKNAIRETHFPENWLAVLDKIYAKTALCTGFEQNEPPMEISSSELDVNIAKVYRGDLTFEQILYYRYLKRLPLDERVRLWFRLALSHPYLVCPEVFSELLTRLGIKDSLKKLLRFLDKSSVLRHPSLKDS